MDFSQRGRSVGFQRCGEPPAVAGVPSVFVRTSGCNLRCNWCETPCASRHPEGTRMTVAQVAA
jgi:organic radical activating enzyme